MRFCAACHRWVFARRVRSGDTGASLLVPADVGPAVEVGRRVADVDRGDHPEAHRGVPDRIPRRVPGRHRGRRLALDRVEEEGAGPALPGVLELGHRGCRIGEVENGDRMEPVGLVGELFGQEVVAPSRSGGTLVVAEVLEHLPPRRPG